MKIKILVVWKVWMTQAICTAQGLGGVENMDNGWCRKDVSSGSMMELVVESKMAKC